MRTCFLSSQMNAIGHSLHGSMGGYPAKMSSRQEQETPSSGLSGTHSIKTEPPGIGAGAAAWARIESNAVALRRRPVESAFRRQAMIFIHRLGIVLYWVGYALALLFAILSLLVALNGLSSGGPISEACVFAVLSVVSWLWGG